MDTGIALQRLLRRAGNDAVSVTGGAEALAMLDLRRPSLMILDVDMPEMNGMTVLRTIKKHVEWDDMKVLMYSADANRETKAEAIRLDAVDFVVKGSISFDDLLARICGFEGASSNLN